MQTLKQTFYSIRKQTEMHCLMSVCIKTSCIIHILQIWDWVPSLYLRRCLLNKNIFLSDTKDFLKTNTASNKMPAL